MLAYLNTRKHGPVFRFCLFFKNQNYFEGRKSVVDIYMTSRAVTTAGAALRELRLHLCQKSAASAGARAFVENHYVTLKKANPRLPILIRECSGISPRLFARYEYGVERQVSLENLNEESVAGVVRDLAARTH